MNKLLIANWKMQLTHHEARTWLSEHIVDLESILARTKNKLVICPSYTELSSLSSYTPQNITWGAQDCSFEDRGALTGDVSIISLAELKCSYVIIGHSERRSLFGDTNERIHKKALLALKYGLCPIICIGESRKERDSNQTYHCLEKQLSSILGLLNKQNNTNLIIAYEPVWAIGSGVIPTKIEIYETCSWIRQFLMNNGNLFAKILYGGSVDENTINDIPINILDGILIGKVSINAQVLKKIILSC